MKIGIIDSGVHAAHPHISGVAGGISILPEGEDPDYTDRIGHGTAVTAVIREKAPQAAIYAVKIFHTSLETRVGLLVRAIEWCAGMDLINISLGTQNPAHEAVLRAAVERAVAGGSTVISAHEWLPGRLPLVTPVDLDWTCPREEFRQESLENGRTLYLASGFPRPIPGVPPERNLKGISFAVANVTGLLARQRLTARA